MAKNHSLGSSLNLCLLTMVLLFSCFPFNCFSSDDSNPSNSITVSSFDYPESKLNPFDWRYIRVDLPPWFSSLSLNMESNVHIDNNNVKKLPKAQMPIICIRDGSPPLPDVSDSSVNNLVLGPVTNFSVGNLQDLQNLERCHLMQKNMTLSLRNNQISPGVWYVGIFNGIGPLRTQSKMINRGSSYTFSANVRVEGCTTLAMWGPYCNQTVQPLSCTQSDIYNLKNHSDVAMSSQVTCSNSNDNACQGNNEPKVYSIDILAISQQLTITAAHFRFSDTPTNDTVNFKGTVMCYARHGAMPSSTLYDYSGQITKAPLVMASPKIGRWYFTTVVINQTEAHGLIQDNVTNVGLCYSLESQVRECPLGKAGLNCTWESYTLQTILRKNPSVAFESHYLTIGKDMPPGSVSFPLEPLLSNSSTGDKFAWTYFLMDIPRGAAGGNIHIQLKSNAKTNYEIYSRFGGLPSLDTWDYYYANRTSNSNGSMFFKLYDTSDEGFSFYIVYAREGTWTFGLRHPVLNNSHSGHQTTMSISVERCPNKCSNHGTCTYYLDASGLGLYSYCRCDGRHGGFDCSTELVSPKGHMVQSVALIASNAAAILPAFWALRQKAFAEWVLFTTSGISSGLYHACDVGSWCALPFHVLQFMDFWLSFMAVVSTFVYLTSIDEVTKRSIHTCVSILTALMAVSGPTRSRNIVLVIAIGAAGLVVGWIIEFSSTARSHSCSTWLCSNILESSRWQLQNIKEWLYNILKTLRDRFRWGYVLIGFIAFTMAAISWQLENSQNYWIWHSMWHLSIYTSSFFFLCSKASPVNTEIQGGTAPGYGLTRQDSFPRDA